MQPDAGEDQRRLEIEAAPVDEDGRRQPGHDQPSRRSNRAASARTASVRSPYWVRIRASAKQKAAPRARMAAPLIVCYVRPLPQDDEDRMDTLTYWNGTWHEGNPAILGPRDHAFWLGSMVFDGGRAFEGCGPDLDLHAERVVRSARALGLNPTQDAGRDPEADARERAPLRPQGRALRPADVLGQQGRRRPDLGRSRLRASSCSASIISPMRAGTPLTLGLCRTHPPADAGERADRRQGLLPLSQFLARRGRDAEARLQQRRRARPARQRGRDLQLQHLPRQGTAWWRRRCPTAASWPASRATARSSCCATPASPSRSAP